MTTAQKLGIFRNPATALIFGLSAFVLIACPEAMAIIGGKTSSAEDPQARATVLLSMNFEVTVHTPGGDGSMQSSTLCSGVLIGDHTVLTAAHCVFAEERDSKRVSVSPTTFEQRPSFPELPKVLVYFPSLPRKQFQVSRIVRHEGYFDRATLRAPDNLGLENVDDLAMLRLKEMAPKEIPRIRLFRNRPAEGARIHLTSMGYGTISFPSSGGNMTGVGRLREVDKTGVARGNGLLFDQRDGHGICKGDSGGPDFVQDGGESYLAGIHSSLDQLPIRVQRLGLRLFDYVQTSAEECANGARSISVPAYAEWIQSHLDELEAR